MLTWARPPRIWPITVSEKRTMFRVIPPWFMMSPARMKNGIAISGKEYMPVKRVDSSFEKKRVSSPSITRLRPGAISSTNAIGIPSARRTTKIQR